LGRGFGNNLHHALVFLRSLKCLTDAIAPGFIETEMTDVLNEDTVKMWREQIPMKRGGTPIDIANACIFLASDMSTYITGQTLHVNGGLLTI
jgi:3-oxoacyl-[acyl-carrier protein] reductase